MPHVYSTLTAANAYPVFHQATPDLYAIKRTIIVKGGANLADKNIVTPLGVRTEITDEELAVLESNSVFQRHVARGHLKVERGAAREIEKAIRDLKNKDESAPKVPEDYTNPPTMVGDVNVNPSLTKKQRRAAAASGGAGPTGQG